MFFKAYKLLIIVLFIYLPLMTANADEIDDTASNNPTIIMEYSKKITEGDTGNQTISTVLKIDKCPDTADIKIKYYTTNGTAKTSDNDYEEKSGEIVFTKNSCTKSYELSFTVLGDTKEEKNELFHVVFDDNGTSSSQEYKWNYPWKLTNLWIKNDDGADLSITKKSDKYQYNITESIKFTIEAKNLGPEASTIKIKDILPENVNIVSGTFESSVDDNFSCNETTMECGGTHLFPPNSSVKINFLAKATQEDIYTNKAKVTNSDDKEDIINIGNNIDTSKFRVLDLGDGIVIEKSSSKNTVDIGDNVNFNIKVTNKTNNPRKIIIKDYFPTNKKGEEQYGTTYKAFDEIKEIKVISDPTDSVTCNLEDSNDSSVGKYIQCQNSTPLDVNKSYEISFSAKVIKKGEQICNNAYASIVDVNYTTEDNACLKVEGNSPPIMGTIYNITAIIGKNSVKYLSTIRDPDGDPITITVSGLPKGFIYKSKYRAVVAKPVVGPEADYNITVTATDHPKDGSPSKTSTATYLLKIRYPIVNAIYNKYEIGINETLNGNVITDNTGNGKDYGVNIKLYSYKFLTERHGKFTINSAGQFTYKPDHNFRGTVKFYYTIVDKYNHTDKTLVKIVVKTKYSSEFKDFELVNPLETRNIIGNYTVTGNTIECVTDKNETFDGSCQNNRDFYNNKYITKYLDIDSNNKTWNSSSANFTLPDSYVPSDGKGIVWAGLFWQGNVNNHYSFTKNRISYTNIQRRKKLVDNTIVNVDIDENKELDITDTPANKVLISIDSDSTYKEIEASRFYYDRGDYGSVGATYAAYADITSILQSKKLSKGTHTITVANIFTNEGIEKLNGDYGGWSLVVIYKQDYTYGKARNIFIYNGFTAVDRSTHGSQKINISGFKLPNSGTVRSDFSVFAGEGEYIFGSPFKNPDTNESWYDEILFKRLSTDTGDTMPGADNPKNIFDSKLANINRDNNKNNNIENTNGIDIDTYDVSRIMTKYRDQDPNTYQLNIEINSNKDYITPSMIAFSTELYAPKICYNADVKIGKFIDIDTQDRNFTASKVGNQPLQMKVMIKSQEADFDLLDSKMSVKFTPNDVFSYKKGYSKTTLPNTYEYNDAIDTDENEGEIAIGSNPTINGGVIGAKELTYSKLYYDFDKKNFSGKFDIFVDAKISFDGVHKVEYLLSTQTPEGSILNIRKCTSNTTYSPVYGTFNVERGDSTSSQTEEDRYSLYTQVVGVPYEISVASYAKDSNNEYKIEANSSATVELELINADSFENNSSAGYDSVCQDPDSYSMGTFVKFDNNSRVKVKVPDDFSNVDGNATYPVNLALKNAAFRVWVLTKKIGSDNVIVEHNCTSQADSSCFDNLYKNVYAANNNNVCNKECTDSSGTDCYNCLRKNFSLPVCSRDNFAIRPESYHVAIVDNNETNSDTNITITDNSTSNTANLAAGYLYRLDVNATKYNDINNLALGYYLNVIGDENRKKAQMIFNDSSSCIDKADKPIYLNILNGKTASFESLSENSTTPKNGLILNNTGNYKLHIEDKEWTKVDQKGYINKPFKNHADCIDNSTVLNSDQLNSTRGCDIQSNFSSSYFDINVNMHPYKFNIDSIALTASPNNSASYVYVNDLNSTRNLISSGKVMALNVTGNILALGKNNTLLTNYIDGCSANNLNIDLSYQTLKDGNVTTIIDSTNNNVQFQYALFVNNIDTAVDVKNIPSNSVSIDFDKKYFDSNISSAGRAKFNSYFNFKRSYNKPINPFDLHFGTFSLNSPLDSSSVDLNVSHTPTSQKDLNSTKTIYYAKIKSRSKFYDDINMKIVKTPMLATIFCNEDLEYCEKYGIDTKKDVTYEYDWWVAREHSATAGEGEAYLTTENPAKVIVAPTNIKHFINGIDKGVIVQDVNIEHKPYTATIVPTNTMIVNYPWMLFNKSKDSIPSYIYKVKFVDIPEDWSGKGSTGYTIDVNASGRKSKKVDW